MRYASNWCLFGAAASTNEKSRIAVCDEACQPTEKSLDVNSENATTTTPYGYCEDLDTVAFTNCAVCYAQVTDHDYLSNCTSEFHFCLFFDLNQKLIHLLITIPERSPQTPQLSLRMENHPPDEFPSYRIAGL